jgi:hypothetical protein
MRYLVTSQAPMSGIRATTSTAPALTGQAWPHGHRSISLLGHPRLMLITVWAIPPNPNGVAEAIPDQPGVDTFATHWNLKTLGPGKQFRPTARDVGDLVFYIPVAHATQLQGVLGLAYVDTDGQVAVVCPPDKWGPAQSSRNVLTLGRTCRAIVELGQGKGRRC